MESFEAVNAEASYTTVEQAGRIQVGAHIMIRGRPCRVLSVSRKAPGKHGHAKCHFVARDVFTLNKLEEIMPAGHNADVPIITKTEFLIMYPENAHPGHHCSLLDLSNATTRADLKLPESDPDVFARIGAAAAEESDAHAVVLAACGVEQIVDIKIVSPSSASA